MAVRFAPSAGRHGISESRALHVIEHCPDPMYPAATDHGQRDHLLFLGPDQNGVPLEIVALELEDGYLLVIHAMKMRRRYRDHYRRVMRWQER